MINIDKLYNLMADNAFQEKRTGNLFFPAYIYTYKPEDEYAIREEIGYLTDKLSRPNNFIESMVINLYDEVISYLKSQSFAGETIFESIVAFEKEDSEGAFLFARDEIRNGFYSQIESKLASYFSSLHDKKNYLIIHGVGSAFPYLRTHEFLTNTEAFMKDFKTIIFYPGKYEDSVYHLFGNLNDDNMYRANHLNLLIEHEN